MHAQPCAPSPTVARVLRTAPLDPPAGLHPVAHWRAARARLEALPEELQRDFFVRRRTALLGRRLRIEPVALPEDPTTEELYLAGLADGERAAESLRRAADAGFAWAYLALGDAASVGRFLELCPDALEGLVLLAERAPSGDLAVRLRSRLAEEALEARLRFVEALWRLELVVDPKAAARIRGDVESLEAAGGGAVAAAGRRLLGEAGEPERRLRPIEQYRLERMRFDRIRTTGLPSSVEARQAFWRALLGASDSWIARWPEREFAWRDRLQALAELADADTGAVEAAGDGALRAMADSDGVSFADDTRLRIARAYVRHGVRLERVRPLVRAAVDGRTDDRSRTAALRIEAALTIADEDAAGLRSVLIRLRARIGEPGLSGAERAGRERDYRLAGAWLSRLSGRREAVVDQLERAFDVRPVYRKKPGAAREAIQPQNAELYAQGKRLWAWAGRAPEAWTRWVRERKGYRVTTRSRSKEKPLRANQDAGRM